MTYRPVPDDLKLAILDALAAGRALQAVALEHALPQATVARLAAAHSYPDRAKIAWAAKTARAGVSHGALSKLVYGQPRPDGTPRTTPPAAAPVTPGAPPVTATAFTVRLLERGRASTRKPTQRLAQRAAELLERLEATLDDEARLDAERAAKKAEAARARAAAKAERDKALAEVRRLEKQLAAAKARARGAGATTTTSTTSSTSSPFASAAQRAGVDSKTVRTWAAANNITIPARGKVPSHVVDAYLAAQDTP